MSEASDPIEQWAVVEIMGHRVVAGRVTEMPGGVKRVDVLNPDGGFAFTQDYGPGALFCCTYCEREVAVRAARQYDARPPIPLSLRLPARTSGDGDHYFDDDGYATEYVEDDRDPDEPLHGRDVGDAACGSLARASCTHVLGEEPDLTNDFVDARVDPELARAEATRWAQAILRHETFLVLDVETTGLDEDARIVEIAVVNQDGEVCLSTRLNPDIHIPAEASAIHGIADLDVAHSPHFGDIWGDLRGLLSSQVVVAYNAAFDQRMIQQEVLRFGDTMMPPADWQCAMLAYAKFAGEWNSYQGDWRWHQLVQACRQMRIPMGPAHAHSAIDDCRLTLALIQKMAGWENEP